jgi:hypothetical protein
VYEEWWQVQKNDKKDIAAIFQADIKIIQRIWKLAMRQIAEGLQVDVSNKRKGRSGRKSINIDLSIVPTIPLNKIPCLAIGSKPKYFVHKIPNEAIKEAIKFFEASSERK